MNEELDSLCYLKVSRKGKKMITDPNWLLSTVVQSAAAFVAIVAGFIISRLLSLSAEKSGLQTKVRDIKLQLEIKKKILDELKQRLLEWDAENFLEDSDVLDLIIASGGKISLTEAMKRTTNHSRSEEELRPYWDEAIKVVQNAFQIVSENFSKLVNSDEFDVFLNNHGINTSSYRLKIYYRVFGKIQTEYEKRHNPLVAGINLKTLFRMPDIRSADEINRYRFCEQDIESIGRDKNALEIQLTDLEDHLKQFGQPQGVKLGIFFLAYFSLVGIVIPVFLLPFPPDQFTITLKWSIFLLFISGLVFFFIYLFKLVQQLSETSTTDKST
jgi:hypothetical protein